MEWLCVIRMLNECAARTVVFHIVDINVEQNIIGPDIEPWRTPYCTVTVYDNVLLILTDCVLFLRQLLSQKEYI